VVADVEVADGKIASVAITGDFFLEPPEALDAITASLRGVPADTAVVNLAQRVLEWLPKGTEMVGFTAEAVATAVHRAIHHHAPRERA
jgi:hypothetical protein